MSLSYSDLLCPFEDFPCQLLLKKVFIDSCPNSCERANPLGLVYSVRNEFPAFFQFKWAAELLNTEGQWMVTNLFLNSSSVTSIFPFKSSASNT